MFKYSIDNKPEITDSKGNVIKDLASPTFYRGATGVKDYNVVKMTDHFVMRPDKVSVAMYGSDEYTEFILKFSGIGNPFNLDEDDVLLVPNSTEAVGMTAYESETQSDYDGTSVEAQIRNFYKFQNQEYKSDSTSYERLANMDIPSGVITPSNGEFTVPYISDDGRTAVIVRNNRMYFGEDSGIPSAMTSGVTPAGAVNALQDAINQSMTALSESNCLYNGMSLADFTRATQKNS